MSGDNTQLVVLGRFGAPYGVKGWMKLISFTDPPENILSYQHLMLSDKNSDEPKLIEIDQSKAHGQGFVAHIVGCDDRELTRLYTGKELQLEASLLPGLDEGEYYWRELEGLRVENLQKETLGRVTGLLETGANDVLVVQASADLECIDDTERLIPFLMERVVKKVDLDQGFILVDWENDF